MKLQDPKLLQQHNQTTHKQTIPEIFLSSLMCIQDLNHARAVSLIRDTSPRALEQEPLSLRSLGHRAGDRLRAVSEASHLRSQGQVIIPIGAGMLNLARGCRAPYTAQTSLREARNPLKNVFPSSPHPNPRTGNFKGFGQACSSLSSR